MTITNEEVVAMSIISRIEICVVFFIMMLFTTRGFAQRVIENFNRDWRFSRGEQTGEVQQINFDDSSWESVTVPHDWAITGPFDPDANGSTGKLSWRGVGWYRKIFFLETVFPFSGQLFEIVTERDPDNIVKRAPLVPVLENKGELVGAVGRVDEMTQ